MINQNLDNNNKQEYQTPVLFEYGDIASITQSGGVPPTSDGGGNFSSPPVSVT